MKIILDPGHGGNLASKRGFYGSSAEHNEGVNNFLTCKLIKGYLENKYVVEVLMTRNKVEDYPTLNARGALATGADLFYSRHSNAFDGAVRGVEVFINQNSSKALSLGKAVSLALSNFMGNYNRGAKNGADLPVTKATEGYAVINGAIKAGCPVAVLAEIGFHDNKTDAGILVDKRVQVAELEAEIIAKFLGLQVKPQINQDKVNGPYINESGERLWFRAIAGSYKTRQEAQAEVDKLDKGAWLQAVYIKDK